jgi:hypothetical protein
MLGGSDQGLVWVSFDGVPFGATFLIALRETSMRSVLQAVKEAPVQKEGSSTHSEGLGGRLWVSVQPVPTKRRTGG